MGLDVYLYRYESLEAAEAYEEKKSAAHNAIWAELGPYEKLSEAQKKEGRAREDGWDKENPPPPDAVVTEISSDSKVHPTHMFKVGYLRSSYNEGGINRVLGATIGKSLGWIFGTDGNEYHLKPDWGESLRRARQVLDEYRAAIKGGDFKVMQVRMPMFAPNGWAPVSTPKEALRRFKEKMATYSDGKAHWFSNIDGEFFVGKPAHVHAVIFGQTESIMARLHGQERAEPCFFVIWKHDDASREPGQTWEEWYSAALEITIEMIEWVLGQPDRDKYVLHWSG